MKKLSGLALRWLIFSIFIVAIVVAYFLFSAFYVYTGDAFLNNYPNNISSNVSGHIDKVFVHESQMVKKGDLLFTLDNTYYLDQFNEAAANLETARLAKLQILSTIASYEKLYEIAKIDVEHYRKTWLAYKSLQMGLSKQSRLNARYDYDSAVATREKAWINLLQQRNALTKDGEYPAETYAKAALDLARYNLEQTRIYAPSDGIVSNISIKPKQTIAAGSKLFAVVAFNNSWIRARLKESFVGRIHPGDKVTISLRMYPFKYLHGTVRTVGVGVNRLEASTSVTSSSLPYLSQEEDWIQLDQRFPVFIHIDDIPEGVHLKVGSSARILIHRNSSGYT